MAAPTVVIVFLLLCAYITSTVVIFLKTNEVENLPYMDEIFHVPQVQQYCKGDFKTWDPMITTLPGLYLITSGLYKPISWLFDLDPLMVCSTLYLRGINLLFNIGNFYLVYKLYRKLHSTEEIWTGKALLDSMSVALFPVLYFYTFLYYTDPGAVFFVLLMYLLHLHGNNFMAAILGALSVIFRQTNIVWVIFVTGRVIGKNLITQLNLEKKDSNAEKLGDWSILKLTWQVVIQPAVSSPVQIFSLVLSIVKDIWMYIAVGAGFAVFVYVNEGIVVGDRSHHVAGLNFPQLFYFLSCTLCFAFPLLISVHKIFDFVVSTAKNPFPMILFSGVAWFWVYKFTYVHEYLLADNRHYPFYVWSKIYARHEFVRYALIPFYYYALWIVYQALRAKDVFWKMTFAICLMAAIVPQKLIEFRYFIIPFIILRLNMPGQSIYKTIMVLAVQLLINGFTLYMYIYRPFKWDGEDMWQRFIW